MHSGILVCSLHLAAGQLLTSAQLTACLRRSHHNKEPGVFRRLVLLLSIHGGFCTGFYCKDQGSTRSQVRVSTLSKAQIPA